MKKEVWKAIKGYKGLYEVSNMGRVKSLRKNKILTPNKTNKGYEYINLCNGKCISKTIHRLVAKAFIRNTHGKPQINHKDINRANNHVNNLEWVTRSENIKHSYKNNCYRSVVGELNPNAKLTEKQVRVIKWAIYFKARKKDLAKFFKVSHSAIIKINTGEIWPNVKILY